MSDHDLLQRYVHDGSQTAFAELVARHLDLVYSAARRQVHPAQLAEEVTQSVFLDLSRDAARIHPGTPLVAWLHLVTRRTAIDAIRRESRRHSREQAASEIAAMKTPSADWTRIEPLLDEALQTLDEPDRCALLLRYFENKSLREVGETLGTSDDAAQKRISRALERLRARFARAGVTLTSAGLIADLSAQAIVSAPAVLGPLIASATVISSALLSSSATAVARILVTTPVQKFFAVFFAAALAGGIIYQTVTTQRQRAALIAAQAHFNRSSQELADLQHATQATRRRALALQTELARPSLTTPGAEPAMAAEIAAWFARLEKLKTLVAQHPSAAIPEMSLLSEKD